MAKAKNAIPEGYHTVTPQLTLDNAAQAIEWYKKALGAEETGRSAGPDGKIMHAEVKIGNAMLMLADENPERDALSPSTLGGAGCSVMLYTDDVDATFKRAIAAGATAVMPPADMFWGDRMGNLKDPFGHSWAVATHKEDVSPDEMGRRMKETQTA